MLILKDCGNDLRNKGVFQWDENYPDLNTIQEDLMYGTMYIAEMQGEIVGTIVLNKKQDSEYSKINWLTKQDSINLVVHRLAVHPKYQGKGIAMKLMDFAENFAVNKGYDSIRLDTLSINQRNVSFYSKRGYSNVGQVFLSYKNKEPYFCFEKIINLEN